MKLLILLSLCLAAAIAGDSGNEQLLVTAPAGKIRGSFMTTRLGKKIYAFRAVRYAQPPVGELRFQPPVPENDWTDVFDASDEGPACPHPDAKNMSEDCLRLNVYTTKLPTAQNAVKRPVIVFFHPGGFYYYTAQSSLFGPAYIMDQDIVLVTVNYRLLALGMISTGDSWAPGNAAFKDQVVALRWVQRNIAAFGGDPNSVTISGCSAGAWSVSLHMLSPMSRGLFHKAIAMSGSAYLQEPLPRHQKDLAIKQAELLGCPTDSSEKIITCLRTKPFMDFSNSLAKFFEWHGDPILVWKPVLEPEVSGVDRFLAEQPTNMIRQGKMANVPLMAGITRDEFGGVVVYAVQLAQQGDNSIFEDLNQNWTTIAPISFLYERGTPRSKNISEQLRQFYFNGKPISVDTVQGLADCYADAVIGFQAYRFGKLASMYSTKPVYFYKFAFEGRYSFATWNATGKPYGVEHQDDLMYLFYMSTLFPFFEEGSPEIPMVEYLTSIWKNFAATGEPIPKNNAAFKNVVWEPFKAERDNYMEITNGFSMKQGLYPARMRMWESLFPLPQLPASSVKG